MVDMATQSENEDLSDIESNAQQNFRKPSFLQVVPEEEHEDDELVNLATPLCQWFICIVNPRVLFSQLHKPELYSFYFYTHVSGTVESHNSY